MSDQPSTDAVISFCILYLKRLDCFQQCIAAIRQHTHVPYCIYVLVQGPPDAEGQRFLAELAEQPNIHITYSPVNLGCGGGRAVLAEQVNTPYIMMLDDDAYVTAGWFEPILEIFETNADIGAVAPVMYTPGLPPSLGHKIHIDYKRKVVWRTKVQPAELESNAGFIEVDDLGGGVMVFRRQLKEVVKWDGRYETGFDDIDKSLQILTAKHRWRQAIALRSTINHVGSKNTQNPSYQSVRWNYLQLRNSYRKFRKKWGLRYPLLDHLKLEVVAPNPALRHLAQWAKSWRRYLQFVS